MTPTPEPESTTMRAAVVPELGTGLVVTELPLPTPGPGEALVKLETSGCATTIFTPCEAIGPSSRNRLSFPATRDTARWSPSDRASPN